MKTITVELSVDSCRKAIKELEKYEREIKPKLDEVCRRLAEIGAQEATANLRHEHGNDDATILPVVPIENGYKIVMQGKDVYFVEFGTGDMVDQHYSNVSVLVAPGSWSETHAKQYMTYGFWFYKGERLEGTEAQKPMYYAEKAIRENARRVKEEVFGE